MHGEEYETFEDQSVLSAFEKTPREFIQRYIDRVRILFIDEAQYSEVAGKNLKLLYDLYSDKIKFVITGSGSFDIRVQVGKYLVGKSIYFELMPLSFEEFLLWKSNSLHKLFERYKSEVIEFIKDGKEPTSKPAFEAEFTGLLNEYLLYGGFPAIVLEKDESVKERLLSNLLTTYTEKDAFYFLNVMQLERFRGVMNYLSLNTGSLIELSSIMRELHVDFKTLENYLSILVNTYIIRLVQTILQKSLY